MRPGAHHDRVRRRRRDPQGQPQQVRGRPRDRSCVPRPRAVHVLRLPDRLRVLREHAGRRRRPRGRAPAARVPGVPGRRREGPPRRCLQDERRGRQRREGPRGPREGPALAAHPGHPRTSTSRPRPRSRTSSSATRTSSRTSGSRPTAGATPRRPRRSCRPARPRTCPPVTDARTNDGARAPRGERGRCRSCWSPVARTPVVGHRSPVPVPVAGRRPVARARASRSGGRRTAGAGSATRCRARPRRHRGGRPRPSCRSS